MLYPVTAFIAPGGGELILIMLVLILLFGAKDAPRMLRNIQNILNKMQRAAADFRYKLMYEDLNQDNPEESSDTSVYHAGETSAEEKQESPPEEHPADDEPEV
jgi:Sec-independent protein translocase protein TatA